ncbi:MAG: hypothetical protein WC607_00980 [Candidatus Micrarchaeia archaeon]
MKTTMTVTLEGYPYFVMKRAESLGFAKTNAEAIRQALIAYGEKLGFDADEEAYALAAEHVFNKGGFKKAKNIKALLP